MSAHPNLPGESEDACEAPASAPHVQPALCSARAEAGSPRGRTGRGGGAGTPDGVLHPSQVRIWSSPVSGLGRRRPGHAGRLLPLLHVPGAREIQQQPAALPARPLGGCPRVCLSPAQHPPAPASTPGGARRAQGVPPARLGSEQLVPNPGTHPAL